MELPSHLVLPTTPVARESSLVCGTTWRVTVLTDRLLRLEYSEDGRFEDRATQVVVNRAFPEVGFEATRKGAGIQLRTAALTLDYDGQPFSPGGLVVTPSGGEGYRQVWHYGGVEQHRWTFPINLGGTARTLDTVDGARELEPGSRVSVGGAALDDSGSLALTADGWVDQRVGDIDLYLFVYGQDYPSALRDFYRLTGPTPLLPRFALGNWWSRFYPYTQETYDALMDRFAHDRLPFSVAVLDMDWHWVDIDPKYGAGWTGYSWNTDLFPDHRALLDRLHRRGMAVTLNVHPAAGVRAYEDRYPALARRLGVDPASGEPIPFDVNPRFVVPYLEELHHPLEDEGVDFWWVDWQQGAHSTTPGLDPLWALNHFHFLDSGRAGRRPLTFSRYAGPGSHRYPVGFSGDTVQSWESLDFQPRFTATAANIGYGWWSHDIGGHLWGYRDEELQTRWFQLGTFSPINRLHTSASEFTGKEPWTFDAIHERVMGDFLRLRHRLLPYLYSMNERAHSAGEPLCRPLYYADARLETFLRSLNSYLFGTELLVAPITRPLDRHTKQGSTKTWLPEGTWIDVFTGVRYAGGREVRLHRPLEAYPVLARAGAIVPLQGDGLLGVANPAALELRVFPGADGEFVLYEDDDARVPTAVRTRYAWADADGVLTIEPARKDGPGKDWPVPASRRYSLALVGVARPDDLDAGASYDEATATLRLDLGDVGTAAGTSATVGGLRPSDNDVPRRIKDFLLHADIELLPKEEIWAAITDHHSDQRRLMSLEAMDLSVELRGPLFELLLANPGR